MFWCVLHTSPSYEISITIFPICLPPAPCRAPYYLSHSDCREGLYCGEAHRNDKCSPCSLKSDWIEPSKAWQWVSWRQIVEPLTIVIIHLQFHGFHHNMMFNMDCFLHSDKGFSFFGSQVHEDRWDIDPGLKVVKISTEITPSLPRTRLTARARIITPAFQMQIPGLIVAGATLEHSVISEKCWTPGGSLCLGWDAMPHRNWHYQTKIQTNTGLTDRQFKQKKGHEIDTNEGEFVCFTCTWKCILKPRSLLPS